MKGADQCPRCASRKWAEGEQDITAFYGRKLRVCINCSTAWEPFDQDDLLDPGQKLSCFKDPCDNCAFRPGSPEQDDKERWKELMDGIKAGAAFYCHKGVPLDIKHEHGTHGFAYPDGGRDGRKLRLCRGYLNVMGTRLERMFSEKNDVD